MRDFLCFFLNGQPVRVRGRAALGMLAPYLRRERGLTGTKIACAEGACGSCSVLLGRPHGDGFAYAPVNACILPLFGCDGCHIITVEGLNGPLAGHDTGTMSPVQEAMVECHGAQCGFCTPGIVVTLTALAESHGAPSQAEVLAALEGNLCRCTGYTPIIEAGMSIEGTRPLSQIYPPETLRESSSESVEIVVPADALEGEQRLFLPRSWDEAVQCKAARPNAIVVAGGTEVGVAMSVKGLAPREVLSLARVAGGDEVTVQGSVLTLGACATWTQVAGEVHGSVPEFAALLTRWGSPQLRNAGTVAGNIVRASPISDSLPFLLVCEAHLEAVSVSGERRIPVADFLNGDRLRPDELLRRVVVPLPAPEQHWRLFKVTKRRAFDRSIVSAAFSLSRRDDRIAWVKIAFGGVAPTALRLPQTEAWLRDKPLEAATWREAGQIAQREIAPVSDASAGHDYRRQLVANLLRKFGSEIEK